MHGKEGGSGRAGGLALLNKQTHPLCAVPANQHDCRRPHIQGHTWDHVRHTQEPKQRAVRRCSRRLTSWATPPPGPAPAAGTPSPKSRRSRRCPPPTPRSPGPAAAEQDGDRPVCDTRRPAPTQQCAHALRRATLATCPLLAFITGTLPEGLTCSSHSGLASKLISVVLRQQAQG